MLPVATLNNPIRKLWSRRSFKPQWLKKFSSDGKSDLSYSKYIQLVTTIHLVHPHHCHLLHHLLFTPSAFASFCTTHREPNEHNHDLIDLPIRQRTTIGTGTLQKTTTVA